MKKIRCAVVLILIAIIAMGVCGCMRNWKEQLGYSENEYARAIEIALTEKYELPFEVESVGGAYGTHDDATIKAWCYSTEGELATRRFMAEVKKTDLTEVKDNYLHLAAAAKIAEQLETVVGNGSLSYAIVESGKYSEQKNVDDLSGYLEELGRYYVSAYVFVPADGMSAAEQYADAAYAIGEKCRALNLSDLMLVVCFANQLTEEVVNGLAGVEYDELYGVARADSSVVCHTVMQLYGEELSTSYDKVLAKIKEGTE